MVPTRKPSTRRTTECGLMIGTLLGGVVVAGLVGFAMVYNLFFQLRENSEQDRMARSAAVVAIKAYVRAGTQPTPLPQRKQITYALDAAAQVVNVDTGTTDPVGQLTTPYMARSVFETSTGAMPQTPITVSLSDKDKDSQGVTMASAEISLGTAIGGGGSYTLGDFSGNPSQDSVIGARVLVNGLSRSTRRPLFARYFGTSTLARSKSQVLVVYNLGAASQDSPDALTIIEEHPPVQ